MALKPKLPSITSLRKEAVADVNKIADKPLPLIGHLPMAKQLNILGVATLICLVVSLTAAYLNNRDSGFSTGYVAKSIELQVQLLKLANSTQAALSGDSEAFEHLVKNKEEIANLVKTLDQGDGNLPPTTGSARGALDTTMFGTQKALANVEILEQGRPGLVTLAKSIEVIDDASKELRPLIQGMAETLSGSQKTAAITLGLSVERIGKDASEMLSSDVTLEDLAQLGMDTFAAEDALTVLPSGDPSTQKAKELFEPYRNSIEILVSQSRNLVEAKDAAKSIQLDVNELSAKAQFLSSSYQSTITSRLSGAISLLGGGLTLLLLLLISKEYLADSHLRAKEAEASNKRNQQAILRLMNELSDLADGDLTTKATVTEDITGAIADSINYTTDELRKLVSRVIAASQQVTQATSDAGTVTKGLLAATEKQATEIRDAGGAVELMTKSIQEVDSSAAQSSEVARRTLEVTEQGARAVQNSVAGMDGIREQIQETSKRIKRLGESSQEIGEIVDLISDITEQTNVLALNAAIQAASAGEAGRGFAVVAEEVQRLAERSGEATKQIGLLVKTIQGDTQDAVAAMEKSTQGVVEGAKLSDEAGKSLQEIEKSTRELTDLVNSISVSTQVQTDMAQEVANVMADILKITEQTSKGTQLTSASVAQLEGLAKELSGSVSGFKL
ncbi:MAG: twitching motility protein PilJ [Gallionellaceae bacterium]|nr:MAG: twitching motility protein PilJ [Gallionellaceae bacterium]